MYSRENGSDGKRRVAVDFPGEGAAPAGGEIPPAPESAPVAPRVRLPPDLLSRVIAEGIGAVESFAASRITSAATAAGLTAEEIAPQLAQTQLGEKRKALIGELVPLAFQEWGVDPELSPTLAIGLMVVPWGFGAFSAYAQLSALAVEKAEREKAAEN